MSDPKRNTHDELQLQIPQGLIEDINELFGRTISVPTEVDEEVLAMARHRFARQRRARLVAQWSAGAAAAAAVVAIVVWLAQPLGQQPLPPALSVAAASPKDIDRNGQVDILDAFTLARRIEAKQPANDEWDINGDGFVNRAGKVDTIAMAAVSLKRDVVQ